MVAAVRRSSRAAVRTSASRPALAMTKLEAAGNDFLVVLEDTGRHDDRRRGDAGDADDGGDVADSDVDGGRTFTAAQVRALCDRRRGVGADGLIVGRRGGPGADLEMTLYNADGTEAEMSGNGIRCLVHAAIAAGIVSPPRLRVATPTGVRTVDYGAATDGRAWARVDMGPVRLGSEVESPLPGTRARLADAGNPHLVVIGDVDLDTVDLGSLGVAAVQAAGGPVNVEVVRPGRRGADLELRVLERGVGETLACGTGTCAVAAVARAWGMAGDTVTVDNPGGRLEVRLGATHGPDGSATDGPDMTVDGVELAGPVRKIADVEVDAALVDRAFLDTTLVDARVGPVSHGSQVSHGSHGSLVSDDEDG